MNSGFLGYRGFAPSAIDSRSLYFENYLYVHAYHLCKWIERDFASKFRRDDIALQFVDNVSKLFLSNTLTTEKFLSLIKSTNREYDKKPKTSFTRRHVVVSDDGKKLEIAFFRRNDARTNSRRVTINRLKALAKNLLRIPTLYDKIDDEINYDAWTVEYLNDDGFYDDTSADTVEL